MSAAPETETVPALGYPAFDADNHYYEAQDAFTRHLDPRMAQRAVQWCDVGGRKYHLVGGKLAKVVNNPTFDPIAKPGAIHDYLQGKVTGVGVLELLREREPLPQHYLRGEARLDVIENQGLEAVWLFPTLGVLYEELLKEDVEAVTATFTAFNRWLDEDWGLNNRNKIFAAPYLSLCDLDWAMKELEWALERDAHVLVMRPSAVHTRDGVYSPGHERFDPFWARVNEAGITMVIHAGDSGYSCNGYVDARFGASFGDGGFGKPSVKAWSIERAALDFLATLIFERTFERFPNLRVASVENGSEYLSDLFRKLTSMGKKQTHYFQNDPLETFKQHVWINPFWEDDVNEVVQYMGVDRVIFGSDWPHIEGMPQPLDYLRELTAFSDDDKQKIMRDNVRELNTRRPA